jgi:hypothetical protein
VWWTYNSEIYLGMVNYETSLHTKADFAICASVFHSSVFVMVSTHVTLQMQFCNWPVLGVLDFKSHHMAGLWVWSSSWGGLRLKFPCTHIQQILNWNQTEFSVACFATTGWQNGIAFSVCLGPGGGKIFYPLPCSLNNWIAISHSAPFGDVDSGWL